MYLLTHLHHIAFLSVCLYSLDFFFFLELEYVEVDWL